MVGGNGSSTSPITLPTTRGSKILAIWEEERDRDRDRDREREGGGGWREPLDIK